MTGGGKIVSKSQFAQIVGRNPAFVTRAIAAGRISGDALVGDGRSARIRVDLAMQQLARALDVSQQLAQPRPILPETGGRVVSTGVISGAERDLLSVAAAGPVAGEAGGAPVGGGAIQDLPEEQLELRNRKVRLEVERAEREQQLEAGRLVVAADVANALRRQLAPLMATFDEVPAAVAKAVSEGHGVGYSEVLITIKSAIREQRAGWAARARALGGVAVDGVALMDGALADAGADA